MVLAACGGSTPSTTTVDAPTGLTDGWRTDFTRRAVDLSEIQSGGPPKDGIPSIDRPKFVAGTSARWLTDREPVVMVQVGATTRMYPIQILIWHEIVNDTIDTTPIAVTYCPLCNTALVFDRRVENRVLEFGTTGKLRNSDLVMYDRQTETWWQQFGGDGIVGELTGTQLRRVPSRLVSFAQARRIAPQARVLSRDTGFEREYGSNPYLGYDAPGSPTLFDTERADDRRLDPKERVVFIATATEALAIPLSVLRTKRSLSVTIDGKRFRVNWTPGTASALDTDEIASGRDVGSTDVRDTQGRPVAFDEPFWFAVAAFRPDVRIVRTDDRAP
jgi:hypothetical protein